MSTARRVSPAVEPCLPGLAPRDRDGLFYSIFPDPLAAVRIANVARHFRSAFGLKGVPLWTDRFHVTIHGFGAFDGLPRTVVDKAIEAGTSVAARPFVVAFDRVTSFAGSDVLVLCGGDGVDGLMMFHHALGAVMQKAGLAMSPHFTPHITLLYDSHRIEQHFIEPICWTVRDFVLVHSLVGLTKHIPLQRWQLRG